METLLQDVRYAFRMLRKNRGFTAVAVLTLALGIGANTAIFSLVHAVLLRPLPYAQPDRLVRIWQTGGPKGAYLALHEQSRTLDVAAFSWTGGINLSGQGDPVRLRGAELSVNALPLLGVTTELGRTFREDEKRLAENRVVIVSHSLWQRQFGGDPNILNRIITLDGIPRQVVGVMPPGFSFPDSNCQLWLPMVVDLSQPHRLWENFYGMIGRLGPGVTREQARTELKALTPQIVKTFPWPMPEHWGEDNDVTPMLEDLVGDVHTKLVLLMGAVGLVLLVACANVANLFLTRAAARQPEMAVRAALGASRLRVIRQLLTESLLIALAGGTVAVALAMLGLHALKTLLPTDTPRLAEVGLDPAVLLFTGGLALLTGLSFGLAPALRASRVDIETSLRTGAQKLGAGRSRRLLSDALVVAEAALMIVLVVGAGLLVKSLWKLSRVETGFRPEGLLTARITPATSFCKEPERCAQFYGQLSERVGALPGVKSVGLTNQLPMDQVGPIVLAVQDSSLFTPTSPYQSWGLTVTPGYFRTVGVSLLRGRVFTDADRAETPEVMVVSQSLAQRFWPGQDPIGKRLKPSWMKEWRTVVGVVGDVREYTLFPDWASDKMGDTYFPYAQGVIFPPVEMTLVVRLSGSTSRLAHDLPEMVAGINSEVPVSQIRTMEDVLSLARLPARSTTVLFVVFAVLALALGAMGIYSVISQSVVERTHEIGVRVAMGALRKDILGLVISHGMRLAAIGSVAGLVAAVCLARLMTALLFGTQSTDPAIYASVILLLAGVAFLACYIPAHRAAKVDPMVALRYE